MYFESRNNLENLVSSQCKLKTVINELKEQNCCFFETMSCILDPRLSKDMLIGKRFYVFKPKYD